MSRAWILVALLGCRLVAAEEEVNVLRTGCALEGLKAGRVVVTEEALTLFDGKRRVATFTHEDLGAFNEAKANVACQGSRIDLDWQMPYSAAFYAYALELRKRKLVMVEHQSGDPSEEKLAAAEKLLDQGKLEEAITELETVEYPSHYIGDDFVNSVVKRAWTQATALYKQKQAGAAADLLGRAIGYHDDMGTEDDAAMVLHRNDHGFFLAEAGRFKDAEPVLRAVVAAAPERKVAHLNLADVLWALGKKAEAQAEYQAYAALADKWPPQVAKRCPRCKPRN